MNRLYDVFDICTSVAALRSKNLCAITRDKMLGYD